jgi:hypothetical protein
MKMFLIDFEVKKSNALDIEAEIRFSGSRHYHYHLESPYHTYKLPMGGKYSLLKLGWKGQSSSALDIEVAIWFPVSTVLCFPLTHTISHIWTIHGRKMFGQMHWTLKKKYGFRSLDWHYYHTYGQHMGCKVPKILSSSFFIHPGKR